jgi:hypothetical protein
MENEIIITSKIKKYSQIIEHNNFKLYLLGYTDIDIFLSQINETNFLQSSFFINNNLIGNFSFILIFQNIIYIGCFGHQRLYLSFNKNKYIITHKNNHNIDYLQLYELVSITKTSYKVLFLDNLLYEKYNLLSNDLNECLNYHEQKLDSVIKKYVNYSNINKKYKVKILKSKYNNTIDNINNIINQIHSKFYFKYYNIYPELDIEIILYVCKINELYEQQYYIDLNYYMINLLNNFIINTNNNKIFFN